MPHDSGRFQGRCSCLPQQVNGWSVFRLDPAPGPSHLPVPDLRAAVALRTMRSHGCRSPAASLAGTSIAGHDPTPAAVRTQAFHLVVALGGAIPFRLRIPFVSGPLWVVETPVGFARLPSAPVFVFAAPGSAAGFSCVRSRSLTGLGPHSASTRSDREVLWLSSYHAWCRRSPSGPASGWRHAGSDAAGRVCPERVSGRSRP